MSEKFKAAVVRTPALLVLTTPPAEFKLLRVIPVKLGADDVAMFCGVEKLRFPAVLVTVI